MATPIIVRIPSFGGLSVSRYFKRNAMENQSDDRAGIFVLVILLAFIGAFASLRSARYYFGGRSRTPIGQLEEQSVLRPWRRR